MWTSWSRRAAKLIFTLLGTFQSIAKLETHGALPLFYQME